MLVEKVAKLNGVMINFAEGPPSGEPLLLIHGGGDRWQKFLPLIPQLTIRWHIYALDLRGHGKSARVPGQYLPEDYVSDVVAFVNGQINQPTIIFGHSLGAWIALLVAAELIKGTKALILGDPPLDLDRFLIREGSESAILMWQTMRNLASLGLSLPELAVRLGDLPLSKSDEGGWMRIADLPGMDKAYLRSWAKTLSQVDPDVAYYHAEGRLDEYVKSLDLDGALKQLRCPMLLLQVDPSEGGMVSDEDVKRALSLASDGLCVKLEGVGHELGLSSWDVASLLRAVMNFLESL
jgi:pimeloyl-ACP methyl ester carboxylesterase